MDEDDKPQDPSPTAEERPDPESAEMGFVKSFRSIRAVKMGGLHNDRAVQPNPTLETQTRSGNWAIGISRASDPHSGYDNLT